jgi:protein-S-isoprenylcysteine O-methyltransferase Ste14
MKLLLGVVVFETVLGLILFGSAGRVDLPWFWALLTAHAALVVIGGRLIDPDLKRERLRPGGAGVDRGFRPALAVLVLAHLVVAGLDAGRFGWSPEIAWPARAAGLVVYVAGVGLSLWAMAVNRFFSPVVRVQAERGHHVIRGGPYAIVRHPGYVGLVLALASEAFVLGSLWSLVPVIPFAVLVVRRTMLEDRFLRANLEGYGEYAADVRFRMAPGVW